MFLACVGLQRRPARQPPSVTVYRAVLLHESGESSPSADKVSEGYDLKLKTLQTTILSLPLLFSIGCSRQASSEAQRPPQSAPAARTSADLDQPRSYRPPARPVDQTSSRDSYSRDDVDRNGGTGRSRVKGRSKLHSAEIIGGTAGVGAAIGALAGGGKGAAIGAIAGGGGGLIYDPATAHKRTDQ